MEAIYLLVSSEKFLIERKIDEILKKAKKDAEIVKYDLLETPIEKVVENLDTYNLLSNQKVIIAENASFLTAEKPKIDIEQDLARFEKYIQNPNLENSLILVCNKLDERKKIVKVLVSKAKIISCEINLQKSFTEEIEDYKIDESARSYLFERCANDPGKILGELEKLKLFKYDEKEITKEDIDEIVVKTIDDNIFALVDAIVLKNKGKAIEIYQELLRQNEEVTKILILLANRFRLLYQVKILEKTMRSNDDIAKQLGVHRYPVQLARKLTRSFDEKTLLFYLSELAQLDLDMKSGNTYQNIAFEMFILSL